MAPETPGRRSPRRPRTEPARGISDGVLVGGIALLLGMVVTVWLATGLAGWFQHGEWPGIKFQHTALAIRHLVAAPHDIDAAWSEPTQVTGLPSPTAFWLTTLILVILLITFLIL